jgi:hypothetical protein
VPASKRAVDSVIYATYCSQPVVLFYAFLLRSSFSTIANLKSTIGLRLGTAGHARRWAVNCESRNKHHRLASRLLLALFFSVCVAARASAQEYLKGFPDPARVAAGYEGPDSMASTARQHAALEMIRLLASDLMYDRLIRDRASGRNFTRQTPEELQLVRAYGAVEGRLKTPTFARGGADSPSARWHSLQWQYESDTSFRNDVFQRFFSPAWVAEYRAAKGRLDARKRADDSAAVAAKAEEAADSVAEAEAARPFHGAPVPADERRFAIAINNWCRSWPGNEQENPIAREEIQREFWSHLNPIVRAAGPVREWSGILLEISAGVDRLSPSAVSLSIDTVSSYRNGRGDRSGAGEAGYAATALLTAWFKAGSSAYAAASRLQVGQHVFFSGRSLEAAREQRIWGKTPAEGGEEEGAREEGAREEGAGEGCKIGLGMELTAIRQGP